MAVMAQGAIHQGIQQLQESGKESVDATEVMLALHCKSVKDKLRLLVLRECY
ncbi:hypothetical protein [Ktedonospora formicarum]|uniref:hypothetical protein n=1 Tax=Ktedonospora formicarum TaxID=2778364 RepID=UPI001C68E0CB|nr:hypothetical protein [Ktedonospora formicarum]